MRKQNTRRYSTMLSDTARSDKQSTEGLVRTLFAVKGMTVKEKKNKKEIVGLWSARGEVAACVCHRRSPASVNCCPPFGSIRISTQTARGSARHPGQRREPQLFHSRQRQHRAIIPAHSSCTHLRDRSQHPLGGHAVIASPHTRTTCTVLILSTNLR